MLTRQSLWLVLALLVPVTPAHAEIYKYYDADGNLVLTDTVPKQHAEKVQKVEPKPIMTIPALPATKRPPGASAVRPVVKPHPGEYVIVIQSPAMAARYSQGGEPVPVAVSVDPGLDKAHRLEMQVDGGAPSTGIAQIVPASLEPGSHTLAVRVVNEGGKELKRTSVSFTIQPRGTSVPDAAPATPVVSP